MAMIPAGAAAASTAKTAATYAGLAISAAAAIQQGMQAKKNAEFEADQLALQAQRDREIGKQDADQLRREEQRRRATLVNLSGGANEGTALMVLSDLAAEAEFQALRLEAGAETQANRAVNQAAIRRTEGKSAQTAGFASAGSSLLTGVAKAKT